MPNKLAIVTGASRLNGIGAAVCRELAGTGHDIFFTCWTEYDKEMPWGIENEEPDQIKEELQKKGVRVDYLELDLSKVDASKKLFDKVEQQLGAPQILINNATYSTGTDFTTLTSEEIDKHYFVSSFGDHSKCGKSWTNRYFHYFHRSELGNQEMWLNSFVFHVVMMPNGLQGKFSTQRGDLDEDRNFVYIKKGTGVV